MQNSVKVEGVYIQKTQTIHPDLEAITKFAYEATVNEDETVEIHSVHEICGLMNFELRIKPNSEHDTAMEHFLATIREHARAIAYEQHKSAIADAHYQIVRSIKQ